MSGIQSQITKQKCMTHSEEKLMPQMTKLADKDIKTSIINNPM